VGHADETGRRLGPLAAWLGVFCNEHITGYTIQTSRGYAVVLEILGRQFAGVLGNACFVAYGAAALAEWLQQKCGTHLLHELRELSESKRGRACTFAEALTALLRDALVLKAGATDRRRGAYEAATEELEERLDRLLDERRQWRAANNARSAARLRKHRPDVLRFLYWEELDATNHRAERQLRPRVVTRKTGAVSARTAGQTRRPSWAGSWRPAGSKRSAAGII
jgi:hypothetical protein